MSIATNSLTVRRAEDRGTTEIRWLHGRHSFSFGRYEVAPICRTLPVLNLAVRLKHKGVCHGKECDSQEAS